MALFRKRKKTMDVVFVEENVVMLGDDRWHRHDHEVQELKNLLLSILKIQKNIMAKIDDLNKLVADLQVSVDTKQDQIAKAIAAFEQTIKDLQAQIGQGGVTDEQLQTVIDNLTAAKTDLESTPVE